MLRVDRLNELITELEGGKEKTLETVRHKGRKTPFKTLLFLNGKWIVRKIKSIDGDTVITEDIDILRDEAIQELRSFIQRERGKQKQRR